MTNQARLNSELQTAFERGRQSVRDGTNGNPYAVRSDVYDQFELGIVRQEQVVINTI